jgi:hypothetical protein
LLRREREFLAGMKVLEDAALKFAKLTEERTSLSLREDVNLERVQGV